MYLDCFREHTGADLVGVIGTDALAKAKRALIFDFVARLKTGEEGHINGGDRAIANIFLDEIGQLSLGVIYLPSIIFVSCQDLFGTFSLTSCIKKHFSAVDFARGALGSRQGSKRGHEHGSKYLGKLHIGESGVWERCMNC